MEQNYTDPVDRLIEAEFGRQEELRRMMRQWDARAATAVEDARRRHIRRLRAAHIVSNILSLAALMILGFIVQALMPKTIARSSTAADSLRPIVEHVSLPAVDSVAPEAQELAAPAVAEDSFPSRP